MAGAAVKDRPATTSGFCGLRLPNSSHRRCPITIGSRSKPATCSCSCHDACPTCGHTPTAAQQ